MQEPFADIEEPDVRSVNRGELKYFIAHCDSVSITVCCMRLLHK